MSATIVTPLIVRDAEVLSKAAVENGPPFRGAIVERVTALVMRVDVASREQTCTASDALLVTCHRALLTVNEWLLSAYTDDKPIHPGAHRLLAEAVQAVLDRFTAEGRQ